jgi:hypothetical protein
MMPSVDHLNDLVEAHACFVLQHHGHALALADALGMRPLAARVRLGEHRRVATSMRRCGTMASRSLRREWHEAARAEFGFGDVPRLHSGASTIDLDREACSCSLASRSIGR